MLCVLLSHMRIEIVVAIKKNLWLSVHFFHPATAAWPPTSRRKWRRMQEIRHTMCSEKAKNVVYFECLSIFFEMLNFSDTIRSIHMQNCREHFFCFCRRHNSEDYKLYIYMYESFTFYGSIFWDRSSRKFDTIHFSVVSAKIQRTTPVKVFFFFEMGTLSQNAKRFQKSEAQIFKQNYYLKKSPTIYRRRSLLKFRFAVFLFRLLVLPQANDSGTWPYRFFSVALVDFLVLAAGYIERLTDSDCKCLVCLFLLAFFAAIWPIAHIVRYSIRISVILITVFYVSRQRRKYETHSEGYRKYRLTCER